MTTATQPKPNPVPAILVYGTPSSPALTQASWFRAEDKEAVKAAAEALKFSVIELQTDADKALAAGAHEGVLKGSGRHDRRLSLGGGLSADRGACPQGSGRPRPVQARDRRSDDDETRVRTKHEHRRGGSKLAGTLSCNPGCAGDRQAGQRDRSRDPAGRRAGSWPPIGTRSANSRASGWRPSSGSSPASLRSSGSMRTIRRSRAGPKTSPFRIRSSASRASDARKSVLANSMGRPSGRPSSFRACPEPGARNPIPNLKRLKP